MITINLLPPELRRRAASVRSSPPRPLAAAAVSTLIIAV